MRIAVRRPKAASQATRAPASCRTAALWSEGAAGASIEAVQFARDDAAFGGGKPTNVDDEFDDLGGESAFDDDGDDI